MLGIQGKRWCPQINQQRRCVWLQWSLCSPAHWQIQEREWGCNKERQQSKHLHILHTVTQRAWTWLPLQCADLQYGSVEAVRQLAAAVQHGKELQHAFQSVSVTQRLRLLWFCTQVAHYVLLAFLLQQQGHDVLVDDAADVQTKGAAAGGKDKMSFRAGGRQQRRRRRAVVDLQYWVMRSGVILLLLSSTGIRFLFVSGCWRNTGWMEICTNSKNIKFQSITCSHQKVKCESKNTVKEKRRLPIDLPPVFPARCPTRRQWWRTGTSSAPQLRCRGSKGWPQSWPRPGSSNFIIFLIFSLWL